VDDANLGFIPFHGFQYFVEVRGNRMIDEYDYDSKCSLYGGIGLFHGAATAATLPMPSSPVVVGYGVSIARNTIRHADGIRGGAIGLHDTWHEPPGSRMYVNTLVHHNLIRNLPVPPPAPTTRIDQCDGVSYSCTGDPIQGVGIHIRIPLNHDTVLHGNVIAGVPTPVIDNGTDTVQVP
jgi:hypothetical protein